MALISSAAMGLSTNGRTPSAIDAATPELLLDKETLSAKGTDAASTELLSAEVIMSRLWCTAPQSVPVLFTAPHNIGLARDGEKDHKPEDFTTFLAQEFAVSVGGGSLAWSRREIERSKRWWHEHGKPDPSNRDPNHLSKSDLATSPW